MGLSIPDDLIDRIYETALVPTLWPDTLRRVSESVNGSAGILFGVRDGYVSALSDPAFAPHLQIFMNEGWSARDLRLSRALALNHPGFVNDGDLLTPEEIATDYVYENYHRKYGIGYVAGTVIPNPSGDSIAFTFQRHQDNGPVPREVVTYLDRLRPHLARASMLSFRLGFERARAQAQALQAVGLPAAVLRLGGGLYAANALFEALMPALFQDRRRLTLADAPADALFADALTSLSIARAMKSLPIAASGGYLPMVVHLVPVRGAANDMFSRALTLVIVTPVDRAAVPTAEVLQGLFDLTPAEARIARAIGQTLSVEDVATGQGVSRETVRSQLKAVLTKTGLSRQSELVSLLAGKTIGQQER